MAQFDAVKTTHADAVLDSLHVGDIQGALGTIPSHDIHSRCTFGQRVKTLLAILGPGLIVMVGDNDAGAFSTYAQKQVRTLEPRCCGPCCCLCPYSNVNQEMVLRLGAVTGVGRARLIFERFGKFWGAFSIIDLFLLNALTIVTEFERAVVKSKSKYPSGSWTHVLSRFLCLVVCFFALQVRAGILGWGGDDGQESHAPPWVIQGDETFIDQYHGSFPSARPNGPNSFLSTPENSFSNIFGLQLGFNLGNQGEFWFRSETIRGIPLSNAGGLGALTNNDMQRYMTNTFVTYLALGFYTRVVDFGGESESLPMASHQFDRAVDSHRLTWTIGKVDVLSYFDGNAYAHKTDDQFLNWCFMTSCAYDYAADARGYTWGAASELTWDRWSARFGWFAMPVLPNQLALDPSMGQHFGVNGEIERRWDTGALKLLVYQGRMQLANFGSYINQTGIFIANQPRYDARRGGGGAQFATGPVPGGGAFCACLLDGGKQ